MRICMIYDCLFPHTVGGAERWYRNLAERLAADGHSVSYLTLRQWERGEEPDLGPGIDVIAVGPRMALYTADGRRRILPPLVFGLGVLRHLLIHGRRHDVVHTCSFPYFSLLAAGLLRPLWRYGLVVDWHEVWSRSYWTEYLGGAGGRIGWLVQRLCAAIPQRAFCFSQLHAARLREIGLRGDITVLRGQRAGPPDALPPQPAEPLVVFAGRLIPEKRAPAVVPAVAAAAEHVAGLRGIVFGDGPERAEVLAAIERCAAPVDAPGFVGHEELVDTLGRALCMVLPSEREGYGQVVVDAAVCGVPSVVVRAPDNAAVELIAEGENGFVAASASAPDLAAAIEACHAGGERLRESTRSWYAAHAEELALETSIAAVLRSYDARA